MAAGERVTLVEYVRQKRREACPVCQLPDDVRGQLVDATRKKIKRALQLEWLAELGYDISDHDLSAHYSGRHDT